MASAHSGSWLGLARARLTSCVTRLRIYISVDELGAPGGPEDLGKRFIDSSWFAAMAPRVLSHGVNGASW